MSVKIKLSLLYQKKIEQINFFNKIIHYQIFIYENLELSSMETTPFE